MHRKYYLAPPGSGPDFVIAGAPVAAPAPAAAPVAAPAMPVAPIPGSVEARLVKLNADDTIGPAPTDYKRVLISPPPFQKTFPIQGEGFSGLFLAWVRGDSKVITGTGPNDAVRGVLALPARVGGVSLWFVSRFTTFMLVSEDFRTWEYVYPRETGGSQTMSVQSNGVWGTVTYDRGLGPWGLSGGREDGTHLGRLYALNPTASRPLDISPPIQIVRDPRVSNRFGLLNRSERTLFVAHPLGKLELLVEGNRWLGDYAPLEGGRRSRTRRMRKKNRL
jgi:hypothetical protein